MMRFLGCCGAFLLVTSASLAWADGETCRTYCRQVYDSCRSSQLGNCDENYQNCLKGCPQDTTPAPQPPKEDEGKKKEPESGKSEKPY
ncbi:MAG TPA: hypothetical protein VI389_06730 [Geobacteraceae bacterium]